MIQDTTVPVVPVNFPCDCPALIDIGGEVSRGGEVGLGLVLRLRSGRGRRLDRGRDLLLRPLCDDVARDDDVSLDDRLAANQAREVVRERAVLGLHNARRLEVEVLGRRCILSLEQFAKW